jgi:lysophospholipase L1-like esterase
MRSRFTRCLSLLALLLASAPVQAAPRPRVTRAAQEKKPEPPVDLGALFRFHYQVRTQSFQEQNQAYRNVVLVGDSITEGFEVPKYFAGRRVLNRGIGGDVIGNDLPKDDPRGLLRRLDSSIFDCAATDVFLMIGINDLNSGHSVEVMETGYRELLRRIKAETPRVRVHVESLLPTRGGFAARNAPVREFNTRLRKLAAEFGYDYLDLHALFADAQGELKAELTMDGLHLLPAGYEIWRREVLRVMNWGDPTVVPAVK